ncbi:murein biosynthesis integral membrane protein MurJ [Deinococcus sp. Marseille-Q6407]|uniref:murein biosynthesis integral membrane protein MurJ n=1 Tax=Deinococcus sp. Marseille-Q6407 TaxID=2969223 RepID=UPI0021C1D7E1|nr:murein biosynthesis integral membrane protein MurJ [Deinococcus sp. Marseille-Q6407]
MSAPKPHAPDSAGPDRPVSETGQPDAREAITPEPSRGTQPPRRGRRGRAQKAAGGASDSGGPKSVRQNTLIVMAGTLGSRLSGVLRQQIINLFDNTTMDAFTMAVKVPNLLRELLAEGALVNSFIPVYKSLSTVERRRLAQAFSGVMIAVNLLLTALGVLGAPWVVDLLLAKNSNVDPVLTLYMTRLVMPFLMLISLSSVAMGLLNADEHFKESSFAPVAFNIASIIALVLLPQQATWLAVGWLIGGLAQLVVQLPALNRFGLLPRPALVGHPALGRVLRQMAPFTLTAGTRQILNIYVSRLLSNAQLFPAGTQAGYTNAEALFTMANGLFVVSPALALFPRFSQLAAEENWTSFRALTLQAMRSTTFMAAPVSALLVALAPYAASIFNLTGAVPETRLAATSGILAGWALALVPWALVTILLRTFYARERTRDAVVVSATGFVLEVVLYNALVPLIGFWGFGVSTAVSGVLMTAALLYLYRRAVPLPLDSLMSHLSRVLPLAVLAGALAWIIARFLPVPGPLLPSLVTLAVAGGLGLVAYLAGALLLRLPEVDGVLRRFRRG